MELSLEVKGYLADIISRESMGRIEHIGMMVGIEPEKVQEYVYNMQPIYKMSGIYYNPYYEGMSQNELAARYIIKNTDNQDILIKTILDMAKRNEMGGKWYTKMYAELNSFMERTMQCRMDEKWNILPILDENLQISKKLTFIERKLEEHNFNMTLSNYKSALNTYKIDYKASIAMLRSTFESLVSEIIESKGEKETGNQKDDLAKLKKIGIINEIDTQQCQNCQYKKRDSEFNYSYNIFSLLSHYGSHKELLTEDLANFLFTSASVFIWFLINRYENTVAK